MEAYFYLRDHGYRIIAKNFRTAHNRGEIDLIAWEPDVLCFVEVKTHTHAGLVPPEMAVDAAKRRHIISVARRYVRRLPGDRPPRGRFDIVSVVLGDEKHKPRIKLYKGAFSWTTSRNGEDERYVSRGRKSWWRQ